MDEPLTLSWRSWNIEKRGTLLRNELSDALGQNMKGFFSKYNRVSSVNVAKSAKTVGLVTFTNEILKWKVSMQWCIKTFVYLFRTNVGKSWYRHGWYSWEVGQKRACIKWNWKYSVLQNLLKKFFLFLVS